MSENQASFIKFLSAFLGALGTAVCVVMAVVIATELLAKVLLFLLAAVFLLIIYPIYKLGCMMEEIAEQNKKISMLATRQAKLLKTVDSSGKYSPVNKNASRAPSAGYSSFIPEAAERNLPHASAETISVSIPSKKTAEPKAAVTKDTATKRMNENAGDVVSAEKQCQTPQAG